MRLASLPCRRTDHGSVIIEFVSVLPLFLLLMLATIDWGWYFAVREAAINATREGARVGSVQANQVAAEQAARVATASYLTASGFRTWAATANAFGTVTVGGAPVAVVSVSLVNYPVPSLTGLGALTRVPTTITTRADMRLEVQP
jgi:Flp pilus assembly protein TadG